MPYDPDRHHRRSIRLRGYDYTQAGAYAVTICTQGRVCVFSTIVDGEVDLTTIGCIVDETWETLPVRFPQVELDAFVVMPNHVHMIIVIADEPPVQETFPDSVGVGLALPKNEPPRTISQPSGTSREGTPRSALTVGDIVGAFKSISARKCNRVLDRTGRFWQRNYYEHIIRDAADYENHRQYILTNPAQWTDDKNHPTNIPANP